MITDKQQMEKWFMKLDMGVFVSIINDRHKKSLSLLYCREVSNYREVVGVRLMMYKDCAA